ncbi:MAG: hypothetical protein ABIH20_04030 [Candidatus Diapherotrites archaeon]
MKKAIFVILVLVAFSGCTEPVEKGTTIENAIVIQADNEEVGVGMEYDYLTDKACPESGGPKEVLEQTIDYDAQDKMYDVLKVECQNGEIIDYYFNIDSFFGKWE